MAPSATRSARPAHLPRSRHQSVLCCGSLAPRRMSGPLRCAETSRGRGDQGLVPSPDRAVQSQSLAPDSSAIRRGDRGFLRLSACSRRPALDDERPTMPADDLPPLGRRSRVSRHPCAGGEVRHRPSARGEMDGGDCRSIFGLSFVDGEAGRVGHRPDRITVCAKDTRRRLQVAAGHRPTLSGHCEGKGVFSSTASISASFGRSRTFAIAWNYSDR